MHFNLWTKISRTKRIFAPQIFKATKLRIFLITLACLQVATKAACQISINEKNASLAKVITMVQKQSGYSFVYKHKLVENIHVSTELYNVTLQQALDNILNSQPLTYEVIGKTVVIKVKEKTSVHKGIIEAIPVTISGKVMDTTGVAIEGASIIITGAGKPTINITKSAGEFSFNAQIGDEITISYIGYRPYIFKVTANLPFQNIVLHILSSNLNEIIVSTGYQTLPKERATGSFDQIDNKLLNRSVSTDILNRINGVSGGVYFSTNHIGGTSSTGGDPSISIRGRSTLFANTEPLIVLDNFPYDGDLNNINPNDVESITVLKDAAAASIWGVRAGNGVIVITSRKGRYHQKPRISFNSNVTVADKPDAFAVPQLTSDEMVDVQTYLFNQGKYTTQLSSSPYILQSPVVDILNLQKSGQLSATEATAQLNALRSIDNRTDLQKYYYQHAVKQQYSINVNGGGENNQYNFSIGYDNNKNGTAGSGYDRITLNGINNFQFLNKRLEISTGMLLTLSHTDANTTFTPSMLRSPYEMLADVNGNPLTVTQTYRESVKETSFPGQLLDWTFKPLNELGTNVKNSLTDTRLNFSISYKILNSLKFGFYYLYQKGVTDQTMDYAQSSYYARNLINTYTQISPTGVVTNVIPIGGIDQFANTKYQTHNGRTQLSFDQIFGSKHEVSAIGGFEIKDNYTFNSFYTIYGYNPDIDRGINVDFTHSYPALLEGTLATIGGYPTQRGTSDRYLSYYANAAYTYDGKYTLSGSARRDESNLFGVKANQKGVPLWSAGFSWNVSQESFYHVYWLPVLKFRLTDGYSGNVSKSLSAYTTAQNVGNNIYNAPYLQIINPPNDNLRWERVNIVNIGVDFGLKNNRVAGSIDLYSKKGSDLIGNSPIAPQTGLITFKGNNADVITKGLDFSLNSININRKFKWVTNILFNYSADKVASYNAAQGSNYSVISGNYNNPIVGKPYSAVYSFKWAGLDATGAPQGYLNGVISKDYSAIQNSTDISQLIYNGQATPKEFGSLRNTFNYQNFEISCNINYKFGYVFRRGSLSNTGLYNTNSYQQADYEKRWQKSGDELATNVPALIYPINSTRDNFYYYSNVLVEKGDHVRLQDVQLSYSLKQSVLRHLPFSNLKIYGYVNNVGIIWRKNKLGLDPDYITNSVYSIPNPRTFAIGLNANFK